MLYQIREGVTAEDLGDEFIIYDGQSSAVHRVSVVGAPWLADLLSGQPVEVDESSVSQLVEAGLIETLEGKDWSGSRRRVLAMAGSATAAIGLTTLFLPSAAAAASIVDEYVGGYELQYGSTRYNLLVYQLNVFGTTTKTNKIAMELTDENSDPADFTYSITGPITTSPTNGGPINGSTIITLPGWALNETIVVTITNAVIGSATVSLTWTP